MSDIEGDFGMGHNQLDLDATSPTPILDDAVVLIVTEPWVDAYRFRAEDGQDYLVTRDGKTVPSGVVDSLINAARSVNVEIKKQEG